MLNFNNHNIADCGFVILCPNANIGQIKISINSLKFGYPDDKRICIVPQNTGVEELKEIKKLSTTYKGGNTITTMLNAAINKMPSKKWNFILMAGNWVKNTAKRKYSTFLECEKDILFPIINKKTNFVDGSINGILLHKNVSTEIGFFPEEGNLNFCKLMWALEAINKGYKFKAIAYSVTK